MRGKITKRTVDALIAKAIATGNDQFLWDTELTGFAFKATLAGKGVYFVRKRKGGRGAKAPYDRIGNHGAWTPELGREEAARRLRVIDTGGDPTAAKRAQKSALTVRVFAEERFLPEHVDAKCKPSTRIEYRSLLNRAILPAIGEKKLRDVTAADATRLHHKMRATPYAANFAAAVARKMFNLAERWGERPLNSNPFSRLERFKERKRERMLSADELGRLAEALATAPCSPFAVAAIKALIFSGARRDEIRTLKWEWIDFARGVAQLPDSKTGAKTLHLPAPALQLLAELPRIEGNPHVIPGRVSGQPLGTTAIETSWFRIRKMAGLGDLRLHDLRHAFASVAASSGQSLAIIGKMLGNPTSVGRYIHLTQAWNDPVKAAAETTASKIAKALQPRASTDDTPVAPFVPRHVRKAHQRRG